MRPKAVCVGLCSLLLATSAVAAQPTSPTPPKLRLPAEARPLRYQAELTVVPEKDSFDGKMVIELETQKPETVLWLNANELTLSRATAKVGKKEYGGRVVPTAKDFVGIAFDPALPAGKATLTIAYTGKLSSKDSSGASRQKEHDAWYVYTHFEPIDARRVFPCFDEPSAKVPWQLTLIVPEGDRAFANTPQLAEEPAWKGMKRVRFAESRPLPSYLVAFAVGPFDVVEAGKSRKSATPVRILTPKGEGVEARWAQESTAEILARLEEYFGSNYPYEKLDMIAVPFFGGAMENPGLVTFTSQLILRKPGDDTVDSKRSYASVATHELAHQWFGDLVTTAWWDDIWLNEAFATWMTPKILEVWQPGWGQAEQRVQTRAVAMSADSLVSARRIRQPIESDDDIQNAFDQITYQKGASVIHMFERWVGADAFRRGVQRYMKEHAYGNATAAQFLQAISAEAGRDVQPAFSTFLEQAGVPLVSVELRCNAGKASVHLQQERYLPLGSPGTKDSAQQLWKLPVCVRWSEHGSDGRQCALLETRETDVALTAKGCPDLLVPNEAAAGYYRSALPQGGYRALLADGGKRLTVPERLGTINDLNGAIGAGRAMYAEALALVPQLARDGSRFVVQQAIGYAGGLVDEGLLAPELRPAYAKFVREAFGERAHKLGWLPRSGDDEDTRLLRPQLLHLVADDGEDPALLAEARKLTQAWLRDHKAVPTEVLDGVLVTAASHGDRKLFDELRAQAEKEQDLNTRRRILGAMGQFRDPAVSQQALELVLTGPFDIRESLRLLWGATRARETRELAYGFVKARFDALVAKLPRDGGAQLPGVAAPLCDDSRAAEVKAFFDGRSTKYTGGPRALDQALERLHLCATYNAKQGPGVAGFFRKK